MSDALRLAVNATLMPGFNGTDLPEWLIADLAEGLGAVCLFGSNIADPAQLSELTAAIHAANPAALVATDEEGGDVTRLHHRDGSPFPSMAYLGRLDDTATTERVGSGIGAELRAAGVDVNLAPVADVNSNPLNPVIGVRSFGSDPALVARHVAAYIRGLQAAGVAAVAKHFPGHGDTSTDSHRELPTVRVDADTLERRELVPFDAAVAAGTLGVMTSHILVPALDDRLPATFSDPVLSVLRRRSGFSGLIVSDALDMAGASADRGVPEAAVLALAAGVDLLCLGTGNSAGQLRGIREHILAAVADGRLAEARVLQAAGRVTAMARELRALRAEQPVTSMQPAALDPAGFWIARPLAPVRAPLLLRLASPANIAAGETPWGIGPHLDAVLDALLPGSTCLTAADPAQLDSVLDTDPGRPLVVQGRDLARVPFLRVAADRVRQRRPDALIVDLGWPDLTALPQLDVATFGSGRAAATGLIHLLAEGTP